MRQRERPVMINQGRLGTLVTLHAKAGGQVQLSEAEG